MLLPTLGTARSAARGTMPGVNVLSRSIVGSYEIAVVGADRQASGVSSDKALAAWFAESGFDLPAAATPVLADYAAKSWVFAAVKLRPDAAASGAAYLAPHPLIFKFKAAAPVYPMRLTGVGNGPLSLDLYIFGASRANVPGLTAVRCDQCVFGESVEGGLGRWHRGGVIGVGHPVLKSIVGALPVATKLSGTLSPAMQAADMPISWTSFERAGGTMQSPRSARWRAAEAGLAVVPGIVVLLMIIAAIRRDDGRFVFRKLGWALVPAVVFGGVKWMATPTVEVVKGGSSAVFRMERDFEDLPERVGQAIGALNVEPTIDRVRTIARGVAEERGLTIVDEDAPYGFAIRAGAGPGTFDMVQRNWFGAPETHRVWPAGR